MSELAAFQHEMAAALAGNPPAAGVFNAPAFAVYRNTVARGTVEALRAAYPTIDMLLGSEMFTAIALDFRNEQPPRSAVLSDYGAGFSEFLAHQPWSSELPYLADVARLDHLWLQSFLAGEPKPTGGKAAKLTLHPATRFAWLATPAMTIWLEHRRPDGPGELNPEWREEGALFTRPRDGVRYSQIDRASYQLLGLCAVGPADVGQCAATLAEAFPTADVSEILRSCIASGALVLQ